MAIRNRKNFVVPPPVPPTVMKSQGKILRFVVLDLLVKKFGWQKGAELGLWQGRTIGFLLRQNPSLHMIGVDLWAPQPGNPGPEGYEGWDHNAHETHCRALVRPFRDRTTIIKGRTAEAAHGLPDGSLDFVFIDADHSEEGCRADIAAWRPKLKPTGWILGHDISWSGVKAAVEDLVPGYEIGPDVVWMRPLEPALFPGWQDELRGM